MTIGYTWIHITANLTDNGRISKNVREQIQGDPTSLEKDKSNSLKLRKVCDRSFHQRFANSYYSQRLLKELLEHFFRGKKTNCKNVFLVCLLLAY